MTDENIENITNKINALGVGVIPTDTIFGIVGLATDPSVIEKIYKVKNRDSGKPFVVLISNYEQLSDLSVKLNKQQIESLKKNWPGPVSVILPCLDDEMKYLHRGLRSLAIRMPDTDWLRRVIENTGPIVATSANISNNAHANNLSEATEVIGKVDFYYDGITGKEPSKLLIIDENGSLRYVKR